MGRKSSKEILDLIGSMSYAKSTPYKFSKQLEHSEKYNKGRINAYDWVTEIAYFLLEREKKMLSEFEQMLIDKKQELDTLNNGDYKNGLFDSINDILDYYKELRDKKSDDEF